MYARGTITAPWTRPRVRIDGLELIGALAAAAGIAWLGHVMMAGGAERPEAARAGIRSTSAAAADGTEWLIGGYGGAPYTHPSDIRFRNAGGTDLTAHGLNWDGRPFKSPIYYGIRAVRWGEGSTGAMVDFLHSKAISQREQTVRFSGQRNGKPAPAAARIGDTFKHLEFSHGHNLLTLNGMLRLGRLTPWLRPYLGAGAGIALPHTEIMFLDEARRTYEYQFAGPAAQAVAGLEIQLPRVTLFVEYKLTGGWYDVPLSGRDSRGWGTLDFYNQFRSWLTGEPPPLGRASTTLISHQLVGGVAARLTPASAPVP